MPGGRPATYSPELADAICEAIATNTRGLDPICNERDDFPTARTVRSWLYRIPEFLPKYAGAREAQAELMGHEILDIADDGSNDTYETDYGEKVNQDHINRSRLRVDTRKWLMSKLAPKKYGEKLQQEVTGNIGVTGLAEILSQARKR